MLLHWKRWIDGADELDELRINHTNQLQTGLLKLDRDELGVLHQKYFNKGKPIPDYVLCEHYNMELLEFREYRAAIELKLHELIFNK